MKTRCMLAGCVWKKKSENPASPKPTKKPVAPKAVAEKAPKKPLLERVLNPAEELDSGSNPKIRLDRALFLWGRGAHAGQLLDISPEMIDLATPEERLGLASILLEAGSTTRATALAAATYSDVPELLGQLRYPALTLALSRMHPDMVAGLPEEVAALERFARQPDIFEQTVRDNASSIAVVGNAPALLEKELGREIDEHRIVIRFNNFQIRPHQHKCTGIRTTHWFRTARYEWLWRRDRFDCEMALLAKQGAFYRMPNGQDVMLDNDMRGQVYDFIPSSVYGDIREQHLLMGASTGFLCLYWLYTILGSLDDVSIYGFKLIDQQKHESVEYFDQCHLGKRPPHDWKREYDILSVLRPDKFPSKPPQK